MIMFSGEGKHDSFHSFETCLHGGRGQAIVTWIILSIYFQLCGTIISMWEEQHQNIRLQIRKDAQFNLWSLERDRIQGPRVAKAIVGDLHPKFGWKRSKWENVIEQILFTEETNDMKHENLAKQSRQCPYMYILPSIDFLQHKLLKRHKGTKGACRLLSQILPSRWWDQITVIYSTWYSIEIDDWEIFER